MDFIIIAFCLAIVGLAVILITVLLFMRKEIIAKWKIFRAGKDFIIDWFIHPNFTVQEVLTKINIDGQVVKGNERYNINSELFLFKKGKPIQVHLTGNPNPLNFREIMKSEYAPSINAENQQSLFKQKLIRDLITEQKWLMILLIAVIIGIIVNVAVLIKVYGFIKTTGAPVP